MISFDPMGVAIDWLDAYRDASSRIVDLYAADSEVECGCKGRTIAAGRLAIAEYWRQRFVEKPAGDLVDLEPRGESVLVSYCAGGEVVQALLSFEETGKIRSTRCGPIGQASGVDEKSSRRGECRL